MITLQQDQECDAEIVETLIVAATNTMTRVADQTGASPSEVLSAQLELFDRTLRGVRRLQDLKDRKNNALEIHTAIKDLLIDHGGIPH